MKTTNTTDYGKKRIELKLKCAWLVAQDRRAYGRDEGLAGAMPRLLQEATILFLEGMERIKQILAERNL